ncbi:undecaprenyl-phosphate glucose phosphotransferase [Mucilaginibacter limnophilus]|uniref:Undecaprenyl-phosphate glucose phosphotransferase n=1 Tax=Mucilaginibacter limnophilus TaxID=1932778 RepID=A0A3S2Y5E9_9SPHI|nr:undecaprenyl-phosphate glucose phosphotransferase [Mucilaginibacter limnophilus]RVU02472.1 undecaprenyl-phosphate glucose phosphotransferase [Mucilaginibacter limnophilus]
MKTRYIYLIYFVMSVVDIIILNSSLIFISNSLSTWPKDDFSIIITANYIWILAAVFLGLYHCKQEHRVDNVFRLTLKSLILFCIFFSFYIIFSKNKYFGSDSLLFFYSLFFFGLFMSRIVGVLFEKALKKHFRITRSVAVIGHNNTGMRLANFFRGYDNHFAFEGFINSETNSYLDGSGQVSPSVIDQLKSAARNGIKELYISLAPERIMEYNSLQKEAEKDCLRLKLVPDLSASLPNHLKLSYMGEFPVLTHRHEPLEEISNRFKKRLFDLVFSSLVIIFLLSWLYPLIGLIIKIQSPGPILFKQLRSGKDNRSFGCYKFRSMKVNADANKQATKDDDRITPIGKFLRRTSLDELPQFFNVFLGDMSVVGPRPHPLFLTEQYSNIINQYMVRQFLKSGITGWAQVNGFRGETRQPELMEKRVEYDIWYLENWSMWLDVKIIFLTMFNVLKGEENAY